MKRIKFFIFVVIIFSLCCSPEKKSYKQATSENTIPAYEHFLQEYPDSNYENQIRSSIETIHFDQALEKGSIEALVGFLKQYPDSDFAGEVRDVLEKLSPIIELKKEEPFLIEGLSENPDDHCWIEYLGQFKTEVETEHEKGVFILWHKREGFDSERVRIDSITGKVGEVLGGEWERELLRKGQQLSSFECDEFGRLKKTTYYPIDIVYMKIEFGFISWRDSQAEIVLFPENKITILKKIIR